MRIGDKKYISDSVDNYAWYILVDFVKGKSNIFHVVKPVCEQCDNLSGINIYKNSV